SHTLRSHTLCSHTPLYLELLGAGERWGSLARGEERARGVTTRAMATCDPRSDRAARVGAPRCASDEPGESPTASSDAFADRAQRFVHRARAAMRSPTARSDSSTDRDAMRPPTARTDASTDREPRCVHRPHAQRFVHRPRAAMRPPTPRAAPRPPTTRSAP